MLMTTGHVHTTSDLMEDFRLKPKKDLALFFKAVDAKLEGLCATYVDDSLTAGTPNFSRPDHTHGEKI
jgi:hypothetical protein